MTGVQMRLVDDLEAGWLECLHQLLADRFGYGHMRNFFISLCHNSAAYGSGTTVGTLAQCSSCAHRRLRTY